MRMLVPLLLGFLTLVAPLHGAGERLTSRPRPKPAAVKPLAVGDEVRTEAGQRRRVVLPDGSILYVNQQTTLKIKAARQVTLDRGEVFVEVVSDKDAFTVHTQAREMTTKAGSFAVRANDGTGVLVTRGKVKVGGLDDELNAGQTLAPTAKAAVSAPRGSELLDWTRELMIAAEPRLVPPSEHCGGALVANTPAGEPVKLTLRKFHIDVFVEDGFARTTIDQTYFNHHTARLEGTFYFPLPADASLSQLAMYVGENLMEGGMVERDYGRSVYERIVHSQQDPALLEWLDGTTFKMRVFPLEARQEKRVLLSYTQKLPSFQGRLQYRFPAGHNLDTVADWSLAVRVKNGDKLTWKSDSHKITAKTDKSDLLLSASEKSVKLDKDVVLDIDEQPGDKASARFSVMEQDGAKYLMVRYRPDWPATPRRERRDWVVLFETSGDRNPLLARTQVEVVRGLLQLAEPDDTLTVVSAATRFNLWNKGAKTLATPENIEAALSWLENAHLLGALDLDNALMNLDPVLKDRGNAHLLHVGSGIPALGERRQEKLIQRIPQGTRYVGIGVGKRWNRALMKEAAEKTGGYFTQINPDESVSWRTFEVASTLNSPRLLNVSVSHNERKNRWHLVTTLIAQGEEICAVTRLGDKEPLPKEIEILGALDGKGIEIRQALGEVTQDASYLPRHWARLEIDRLLANPNEGTHKTVVALSKAMYVMTPYTSLLVLENDDMYTQYKVERNRKDLWAAYPAPKKIAVKVEGPLPGDKPTAEQVLNTILVRGRPALFQMPNGQREEWNKKRINRRGMSPEISPERMKDYFMEQAADPLGPTPSPVPMLGMSLDDPTSNVEVERLFDRSAVLQDLEKESAKGRKIGEWRDYRDRLKSRPSSSRGAALNSDSITRPSEVALRAFITEQDDISGHSGKRDDRFLASSIPQLRSYHFIEAANLPTVVGFDPPSNVTIRDLRSSGGVDSLLYRALRYRGNDQLFSDLLHYAPGMDTSVPDILAVLENEAIPTDASKLGKIDDKALALFGKARKQGWKKATVPASGEIPTFTIFYDVNGRYAYERLLPPGITEIVICDGKTIWHLYPDLHVGAKRAASRFHRLAFAALVPQYLPTSADLARGADLVALDDRTAALVPFGAEKKDAEGKAIPYVVVQFHFGDDDQLRERRMVQMPEKKVLRREVYDKDGVRWLDGEGKDLGKRAVTLEEGTMPQLEPKVKDLIVLDLPYRTPEHVRKVTKTEKKNLGELAMAEGLPLLASYVGQRNGDAAFNVFQQVFHNRDQRQMGYYVLLAACGRNLDSQNVNVLSEHRHEPLAQYLALYSSPLLREHASQWATGSGQWKDNFLQRLAVSHALLQRWQSVRSLGANDDARAREVTRAGEYIRTYPDSPFAWALLTLMIERTQELEGQEKDVKANWETLVGLCQLIGKKPAVGAFARYEHARALFKTGKTDAAVAVWRKLFEEHRERGTLLRIDGDFRTAFQSATKGEFNWNSLLAETGRLCATKNQRELLVTFAWQLWELSDPVGAGRMMKHAQDNIKDNAERESLQMLALQFYWKTRQHELADQQLRAMLADKPYSESVEMWQFASEVAQLRQQPRRVLECLEKAAELAANQGDKIDAPTQLKLNEALLEFYEKQAESLLTLQIAPPADFRTKVVRTADRMRANGSIEGACHNAAFILRQLGEHELAWDYLTTPVAEQPYESGPWAVLARRLIEFGELPLADRAYAAAYEAERTNAQLLWDRALSLRQGGKTAEAKSVLKQLAEGTWQPRFRNLQEQAKAELDR